MPLSSRDQARGGSREGFLRVSPSMAAGLAVQCASVGCQVDMPIKGDGGGGLLIKKQCEEIKSNLSLNPNSSVIHRLKPSFDPSGRSRI